MTQGSTVLSHGLISQVFKNILKKHPDGYHNKFTDHGRTLTNVVQPGMFHKYMAGFLTHYSIYTCFNACGIIVDPDQLAHLIWICTGHLSWSEIA
jgi:hypothetical protein